MERVPTVGEKILRFVDQLSPDFSLPEGVTIMHPYKDKRVMEIASSFYHKFYNDHRPRTLIFAINPGRLGAGITGIPFTDPVRLKEICGIPNDFHPKKELSGEFIYEMIAAYGGPKKFYGQFMLTSLCPLGFVKEGKNVNYYDRRELKEAATPFIIESIIHHKTIMDNPSVCLCLGEGKNYQFLCRLNEKHHFFSHILPLSHPRYIMQYQRKKKAEYLTRYLDCLSSIFIPR